MTLIFNWGTVTGTPNGAKFVLSRGIKFELGVGQTYAAAEYADGTMTIGCPLCVPATKDLLHLSWDPIVALASPPTAKSILHVGESNGLHPVTPGTTPTLLNYDEAMEFAKALRKVAPARPKAKGHYIQVTP